MAPTTSGSSDRDARRAPTPYRELLVVFGLTWLLLLAHGAIRRDLVIGGVTLVKPELATWLHGAPAWPSASATAAGIEPEAAPAALAPSAQRASDGGSASVAPAPTAAPAVDPRPQRILLLGDSMVEVLQPRLSDYCLENGHKLFPAIWYASTTASWAVGARARRPAAGGRSLDGGGGARLLRAGRAAHG